MSVAITVAALAITLAASLATVVRRLPRGPGSVAAFAAFTFDSVALFVAAANHAAGWMEGAICFALTGALAATVMNAESGPDNGSDNDDSHGGGGGGPDRSPRGPAGPSGDPAWWPEFERQFAAYAARRRRPVHRALGSR